MRIGVSSHLPVVTFRRKEMDRLFDDISRFVAGTRSRGAGPSG